MAKYLFVYHGGKNPQTQEEIAEVLDAWVAGWTRWVRPSLTVAARLACPEPSIRTAA